MEAAGIRALLERYNRQDVVVLALLVLRPRIWAPGGMAVSGLVAAGGTGTDTDTGGTDTGGRRRPPATSCRAADSGWRHAKG